MKRIRSFSASAATGLMWIVYSVSGLRGADDGAIHQVIDPLKLNARALRLLAENKQKQLEAARGWKVFHDFQFSDRCEDSGIRFEHHAVDDAAKNWKPAHYDHGSGIAVADVDGDGLP